MNTCQSWALLYHVSQMVSILHERIVARSVAIIISRIWNGHWTLKRRDKAFYEHDNHTWFLYQRVYWWLNANDRWLMTINITPLTLSVKIFRSLGSNITKERINICPSGAVNSVLQSLKFIECKINCLWFRDKTSVCGSLKRELKTLRSSNETKINYACGRLAYVQ
jgi:hypothetical protein